MDARNILFCWIFCVYCNYKYKEANGLEEENTLKIVKTNKTSGVGIKLGAELKVNEDFHCRTPERYSLCFADKLLIELEKGVYALNLSYYRKANTSWNDNAISIFEE